MPIRRLLLTIAVVAVALGGFPAAPAAALEGEPIVLRAESGTSFSADYGPMPVADTGGALTHPGDCALSPACTEIPLTVVLPDDFDVDNDEFFFNFTAAWEGNVDLVAAGAQDLDIYFWTLRPNEETGEEEYVEVGSAATASQPERTRLFNFIEGEYVITVINFLGVNTGFRLTFDYVDVSLPDDFDPFDGAGRTGGASPSSGGSSGAIGAGDTGGTGGSSSVGVFDLDPGAPAPSSPASLTTIDAGDLGAAFSNPGDSGLGDFGSFNQFQKELNAEAEPSTIDLLAASRRELGPAKDVGAPVLLLWLLLLPLLGGGAALFLLIRRRPAALTLSA